jgi:hypothetical protein
MWPGHSAAAAVAAQPSAAPRTSNRSRHSRSQTTGTSHARRVRRFAGIFATSYGPLANSPAEMRVVRGCRAIWSAHRNRRCPANWSGYPDHASTCRKPGRGPVTMNHEPRRGAQHQRVARVGVGVKVVERETRWLPPGQGAAQLDLPDIHPARSQRRRERPRRPSIAVMAARSVSMAASAVLPACGRPSPPIMMAPRTKTPREGAGRMSENPLPRVGPGVPVEVDAQASVKAHLPRSGWRRCRVAGQDPCASV